MNFISLMTMTLLLFTPSDHYVTLEALKLNFQQTNGRAQVQKDRFSLNGQDYLFQNSQLDVTQTNGVLTIDSPADNFRYELNLPLLNDVSQAEIDDLWAEVIFGKVAIRLPRARLEKGNSVTTLEQLTINCRAQTRMAETIDACINYGQLKLNLYQNQKPQDSTDVRELELNISKGRVSFGLRVAGIGKINGSGTISHDSARAEVVIKIERVRFGILDVTGQFFNTIKDIEGENIKVQRPFITITY